MQSHIQDDCDLPGKISKIKQCIQGCKPQTDAGWVYRYVGSPLCYTLCLGAHAWDAYDCIDTQLDDSDPINLGIKVPVGDLDLWLNGGTQSSNCNRHNYFGDMLCSHVESKLLFGATMRKNCHIAHKCKSYRKYKSGRCDKNKISLVGWNLHPKQPITFKFPNNYYMDTEFTSGDYYEINADTKAPSESITTKSTAQSTAVPPITIQSTVDYETIWAQRSTLTKRTSSNTLSSSTASGRWYDKTTDIPREYETVWTPRSTIEHDTTTGPSTGTALEYKTVFTPTQYTTVFNLYLSTR